MCVSMYSCPGGFGSQPSYNTLGCSSHTMTPSLVTLDDLSGSQASASVVPHMRIKVLPSGHLI